MPELGRIAVLGGGAMGALLGALLAEGGERVTVFDVDPAVLAAIRAGGVRVRDAAGERLVTGVDATSDARELGSVDTVFVFVKVHQTAAALAGLRESLTPSTRVLTLQNGWGAAELIAEEVGAERTLIGVTYTSVTRLGPAEVERTSAGRTVLGPYERGAPLAPVEEIAARLTECGLETVADAAAATAVWRKLILNAAAVAPAGLTGLRAGELTEFEPTHRVVDALAAEATAVAAVQGHLFDAAELSAEIHAALRASGSGKPSMLQDVEARRGTEIEAINGAIVRAADVAGIEVPWNQAMVELVRGLERSWEV